MPDKNVTSTVVPTASTNTVITQPEAAEIPNVRNMDSTKLETFIKPSNTQVPTTAPESSPDQSQDVQPEVKQPADIPVPDKFRNTDGTVNLENLVKSYTEAEKQLGRTNNASHENELLKQQMDDLRAEIDESRRIQEELQSKVELPGEELTQEQITRKIIREEMYKQEAEARKQRIADYEILTAINKARETLPNFKQFEPEIEALSKQSNDFVKQSPKAVELLYNAVIGAKAPDLVNFAKQMAFKEGYEKAKAEMKMQVEGGGRDTTPIDTSLNTDSVGKLSSDQLEKMLPKRNDSSTTIVY